MNQRLLKSLLLCAAGMSYVGAWAASTATTTMLNTATVTNACSVIATGFVANYDPIVANASANDDSTATVATTCTLGATPYITLGQGSNPAAGSTDTAPARRLLNGSAAGVYLNYSLYSDAGRTTAWGNTAVTGLQQTGLSSVQTSTVYARIPGGQTTAKAGIYTDTVLVTITY